MSDVLVVDDEEAICLAVTNVLKNSGISASYVTEGRDCLPAVNDCSPKVVILDLWFQDFDLDGFNLLKLLQENNPDLPVIIISGQKTVEVAARAVQLGAFGFFPKPVDKHTLLGQVKHAMEVAQLRREKSLLKSNGGEQVDLVGSAPSFRAFTSKIDQFVDKNARLLLRGKHGSGKRHTARYIHSKSGRETEPFIEVNFMTLDRKIAAEKLFGRQGDFGRFEPGFIERAGKGTIYLDEIAEIPSDVQPILLRAIVSSSFQRCGGSERVPLDCRIISGTSADIEKEVESGMLNRDLFSRLNVVSAQIPQLDDRIGDIEELAVHFVSYFNRVNGLPLREFEPVTLMKLTAMDWPGNVRQLKNLIERIMITGPPTGPIRPDEIMLPQSTSPLSGNSGDMDHLLTLPLREAREEFEREYLIRQINRHNGNISDAAKIIGMERSALHRKLKGLDVVTKLKSGGRVALKSDNRELAD